ncbi:MAG: bifunctional UDP-sugar hydrolase/5'-nucleotidase [Eubacteriales bacterium]|nr:bifunctional UDP-sugar hydrolase/5'-nucleotidase [Eubacteriales bacterium]
MKKHLSLCLAVLILLLVFAAPVLAETDAKELTLAFTHDLHSYLDTKAFEVAGERKEVGGFAKLKTIFDAISAEQNTLIVDAGDFSMGTLYQSVFTEQAIELRMLGSLGYDATTFGNHEFDYGSQGLAEMLDSARKSKERTPEIVISNIDFANSPSANAKQLESSMQDFGAKEYLIMEKGDVRVALFGVLGDDAAKSAPNSDVVFTNIVEQAKKTISTIKEEEEPDIIVCLSHSGTWADSKVSEDEILAKEVPEIDVIVSGHTHSLLEEPIVVNETYIVSCGEYGGHVGKIDLVQSEAGRWDLKDYDLIAIDETIPADADTLEQIDEYRVYVNEFLQDYGFDGHDQIIAYNPYLFTGLREMNETHADQAIGNLISDAIIYATKEAEGDSHVPIDVSVVPVGIIRASFNQGPLTISDIYEVMSLGMGADGIPGYPLASVYLTGKELKTLAEIDASITPIFESAQLYSAGLSYQFNPNRIIFNRATDVRLIAFDGQLVDIQDDKLYRIVADLYSAQMLGAVMDMSKGLLSLELKDADGNIVADYNDTILHDSEGREVKEWFALASYMQSFEKVDGVPTIPTEYAQAQNRKILDDSLSLTRIFRQINSIAIVIILLVLLIVALLVLLIRFIVIRLRRRRKKAVND